MSAPGRVLRDLEAESARRFGWGLLLVQERVFRHGFELAHYRFGHVKILDVGGYACGLMQYLKQHYPPPKWRWSYVAIDIQKPPSIPPGCVHYVMNAEALEFQPGSFNYVVFIEVLEHIVDYVRALREAHRVLAPKGLLFVQTVDARHPASVLDPTHLHVLRPETLTRLLRFLGFNVLRAEPGDNFAVLAEKVV